MFRLPKEWSPGQFSRADDRDAEEEKCPITPPRLASPSSPGVGEFTPRGKQNPFSNSGLRPPRSITVPSSQVSEGGETSSSQSSHESIRSGSPESVRTRSGSFTQAKTASGRARSENILMTPFQWEEAVFRAKYLSGLQHVETRIGRIVEKNLPLPARFFDGRRPHVESLSACLGLHGIECSPNAADPSLSFITAVIAAATGVHGRKDLATTTRPLFDHDHEVHNADAMRIYQSINKTFPRLAHLPIGAVGLNPRASEAEKKADQLRIGFLLEILGDSARGKLNVSVLDIESGKSTRGKQMTHLAKAAEFINPDPSTKVNAYLVYDRASRSFLPLRSREVLTNPLLATGMRYRKRSLASQIRSTLVDMHHPFSARVKAWQMPDTMLYEKAVDKATGKPRILGADASENEYIKEWLKRTDPDYKLKKQASLPNTRFQKFKSALPFTLNRASDNLYLDRPTPELTELLADPRNKPSRKEQQRIRKSIDRNELLGNQPAALNPLPPTPVAITSPHLVKAVLRDFDALLQPGGDPARSPLAEPRLAEFRLLLSLAQVHIVDGFKTGNQARMTMAESIFKEATIKFVRDGQLSLGVRRQLERVADSIGDLYIGTGPLPVHERTAEIADVLRRCGYPEGDVAKFSTAVRPIMAQRREARQALYGFLKNDAIRGGHSAEMIRSIRSSSEDELVLATFKVLLRRASDMENALEKVIRVQEKIDDIENPRAMARPGSVVAQVAASMHSSSAPHDDASSERTRLHADLARLTERAKKRKRHLDENRDVHDNAEKQANNLKALTPAWNAINAIWAECDAFQNRTAPLGAHPDLIDSVGSALQQPMEALMHYLSLQAK